MSEMSKLVNPVTAVFLNLNQNDSDVKSLKVQIFLTHIFFLQPVVLNSHVEYCVWVTQFWIYTLLCYKSAMRRHKFLIFSKRLKQ